MNVSNKYEAVLKPMYVYVRCDCPRVHGNFSSHIIFLFDAFDEYAQRIIICMECRRFWKDDVHLATQLGNFAQSALSHELNPKWRH